MTRDEVQSFTGKEIGVSDWFTLDQEKINQFADLTEDHMFLHVDPYAAKVTPFGGTIAHGLLTLSMMPVMAYQAMPGVSGTKMGVNYGYNKVRLMAPIKNGKRGPLLRGVNISGRAFDVLSTVSAVSSDFRWDLGAGFCGKGQPAKVDAGGPWLACEVLLGGRQ